MNKGDKVSGTYYGEKFTGIVESIRPEYSLRKPAEIVMIYTDEPVKTPSGARHTILITHRGGVGITKDTTVRPND